ncbi:MAG: hypothetical protein QNJ46_04105 [Leptolyngbyaceae cyanobacterium MO_188.B28]|nr:hypothetical protein [Leptolyngbyaceae cyanobacterium MO_188.B28]
MVHSNRRQAIRQFYQEKAKEFYNRVGSLQLYFDDFFPEFCIGSLVVEIDDYSEPIRLIPRIQRINQEVPKTVLKTFNRHLWYSQFNLSDIVVVRVPIDGLDSFAMLVHGHFNDWWDNGCTLFEIFDERGAPVGAATDISFVFQESDNIQWLDRQLDGDDYVQIAPAFLDDLFDEQTKPDIAIEELGEPLWLLESKAEFFCLPDYW